MRNNKNISYEPRILNVSFAKSKSGSTTTRLTLPITWLRELGITEEDREVIVKMEGDKIIIEKNNGFKLV